MTDDIGNSIQGAKTFGIDLNNGAATGVMLVRFDGGLSQAVNDRGYRSTYNTVVLMDAGREWCYTDRHDMARNHPIAESGDPLFELLRKLSDGEIWFDDIEDGYHYNATEVEMM